MTKKRVLVCGASGFIGRNIFERLSERKDIELIGTYHNNRFSSDPRLVKVDLTDKHEVNELLKGVDILIQAAAVTSGSKQIKERPFIHITDNGIMNLLMYQASFDQRIGMVIFFSCSVMYPGGDKPAKESDLNLNDGMHPTYFGAGWTKIYLEKMCDFYSRLGRTKFLVIRHSNIYGPYDKYDLEKSHMFGANVTKVMTAKDGDEITVWGTGQEKRDLVYVSDLVDFVELAMAKQDRDSFDLVNVGCGEALSVNDIISKIITASGKNLSLAHNVTGPTIPVSITLDATRAKDIYGWQPKVSLDAGIIKTIEWYHKNILHLA